MSTAKRAFPLLLSELDLGFTKLRNRVLMGSSASHALGVDRVLPATAAALLRVLYAARVSLCLHDGCGICVGGVCARCWRLRSHRWCACVPRGCSTPQCIRGWRMASLTAWRRTSLHGQCTNRVCHVARASCLERGGLTQHVLCVWCRAKGGVGLMVTGGIAPNRAGRVSPAAAKMTSLKEATPHRAVTDAVHQHGGKIAMQV